MRTSLTRGLAVAAAFAAATVGLATTNASAMPGNPADTKYINVSTLAPTTGAKTTSFSLTLTGSTTACPGDSASGGYRVNSFIVPAATDPATLTFTATSGPNGAGNGPLYDTTGSPMAGVTTAAVSGAILGIPNFNFNTVTPAAGKYWVGIACTLAGANTRYWATNLTVDGSGAFSYGWLPNAPVLSSPLTVHDGEIDGSFTFTEVPQTATGFTVTAHPSAGSDVTMSLAAGASSFVMKNAAAGVTGTLVNGTQYAVTLTATNSVGTGSASNSVNATPAPDPFAAPTGFVATPGPKKVDLSWTAPAGETQTRTGYSLVVKDSTNTPITGSPFSIAAGATTYSVTGLTAGASYTFQLTALYSGLYTGTASASIPAVPTDNQVTLGDVSVIRPQGALVLTQVCGRYGALPARAATANFPKALALETAVTGGSAPFTDNGSGVATNTADGGFANYPFPTVTDTTLGSPTIGQQIPAATYPTHCGLSLGEASLITADQVNSTLGAAGNLAGQYFTAAGRLNQVTVVDTRDSDSGWTLSVKMGDFTTGTGGAKKTFGGNHAGVDPVLTGKSGNTFGEYANQAAVGSAVEPMGNSNVGISSNQTLASAAANHGLGMAVVDARVELLVPVWVVAGTYTATLTVSALAN